jgi:hypothetical protein
MARAALARGEVRNSLRDGLPTGPILVPVETAAVLPAGPAIVLGLPVGGRQANKRRYPIVVIGRGYSGVLVSDSTRIPGLVSIADVAPTALQREDGLRSRPDDGPAGALLDLDRRIATNNDGRFAATLLFAGLVALLAFIWPRAALVGFASGLAANLILGLAGVATIWVIYVTIALAVGVGGCLLAVALRSPTAIGLVFALVLAAYLLALGVDGPSVALSPLGPSQNARFYGISNLLETLFLVPALAGAVLLTRRFGPIAFAAVALLAFVLVAGSRFGADGGGAIVLAAGYAALAALLFGARALLISIGGAVAVLALLVGVDAATGASSHVTRAVEDGPGELAADLGNRIVLSWERITATWYVGLLIAAGVLALAVLVARTLRRSDPRARRAVPLSLAAAIAVSLVVNDSPNDVVLGGVVGYLAVERGMLSARCAPGSFSLSRLRSLWSAAGVGRTSPPSPRP